MKAKRIAEIAHKMSQLNKEMDALSADLKDEHGPVGTAQLIARAVIENTLKATLPAANSDQLRAELTANNIEMNRLTERNDAILSTLRGRGFEPVRVRSEGWYLDTPSDRNGNKYFNIEWTQNITPYAEDGVVDEYRDDIVVTIETFERVWNKDTGLFENGTPIDINELQDRFVQLRFNEIKVEHEELGDDHP